MLERVDDLTGFSRKRRINPREPTVGSISVRCQQGIDRSFLQRHHFLPYLRGGFEQPAPLGTIS